MAMHPLAGDSAGSVLSSWLCRYEISFRKVWNVVLLDSMGEMVF